jgi:hypothetical protein
VGGVSIDFWPPFWILVSKTIFACQLWKMREALVWNRDKQEIPCTTQFNSEIQECFKVKVKVTDRKEELTAKLCINQKLKISRLLFAYDNHLWTNKEWSHVV